MSTQSKPVHDDDFPNEIVSMYDGPSLKAGGFKHDLLVTLRRKEWIKQMPDGSYSIISHGFDALEKENNSREEDKRKNELAHTRQWYETENAKSQFDDYPRTKKQSLWAIRLAGLTLLIEVIWKILEYCKIVA